MQEKISELQDELAWYKKVSELGRGSSIADSADLVQGFWLLLHVKKIHCHARFCSQSAVIGL